MNDYKSKLLKKYICYYYNLLRNDIYKIFKNKISDGYLVNILFYNFIFKYFKIIIYWNYNFKLLYIMINWYLDIVNIFNV